MDRLFLDASVLFSDRANAGLLQFWKLENVALCSSGYAFEEARITLAKDAQKRRLEKLARPIEFFDSIPRGLPRNVVLPDKDVPILLAALGSKMANCLKPRRMESSMFWLPSIAAWSINRTSAHR